MKIGGLFSGIGGLSDQQLPLSICSAAASPATREDK